MRTDVVGALTACWIAIGSAAQTAALSPQQVMARMVEADRVRTAQLRGYTSVRHYRVENKRFNKRAEMTVQARFTPPGRKEFTILSESGSGVIRQRVFRRMLASEVEAGTGPMRQATLITPENYVLRFTGPGADRGRQAYVFEVVPKAPNKFLIKGRIWVDAEDFAITRIEGSPAVNPSFWIRSTVFVHTYQKVGPVWLAASNVSHSHSFFLGETVVEVGYGEYRVNQAGQ